MSQHPPIHHLPESAFVEALNRLGGTPEAILQDDELMQLLLPCLRADFEVFETYAYAEEPPLDCRISAFGGLMDPLVNHEDLMAWRSQTCSDFALHMFHGDHFFLNSVRKPLLQTVAQDLMEGLERS
jgi:hypothetical protein